MFYTLINRFVKQFSKRKLKKKNGQCKPPSTQAVYDLLAHSIFSGNASQYFNPVEPPESWKNLVRGILWHEDLECRLQLLNHKQNQSNDDQALRMLKQNGWVNMGAVFENIDALIASADKCFMHDAMPGNDPQKKLQSVSDPFFKIPLAAALLEHSRINHIVTSYLGRETTYHNALMIKIPTDFDYSDASGLWHNDKVGHRLKVFLLLSDVEENGRPTIYARGSHLIDWPSYYYQSSRFQDTFVKEYFELDNLYGKKGDVIIFDTNGLHRASWEPNLASRSALMLEYGSHKKYEALKKVGHFPFGIHPQKISNTVNVANTLIAPQELQDCENYYLYGAPWPKGVYSNFN